MESYRIGFGLQRRDVAFVIACFALSRALYGLLGLQFDASPFPRYLQFIDAQLLKSRLLESLWYYHVNPPMLNLFVGIGEKLFGGGANVFFNIAFHLLGLLVAFCVYILTWNLSSSRITARITTGLLVFSPSFVLYENWLMYSFPAAALLTIAALALYQYVQTRSMAWCVAFFGTLAALLLTRSLFHIAWLVLIIALLTAVLWEQRRQVLTAAAVPLLVVTLWYGKNYYYFNVFSSSTLMGLGLSNITTLMVPQSQLWPLVKTGELSPFAVVSRYENTDLLFSAQHPVPTGIPVLDQVRKSGGEYNYNARQMIPVNHYYMRDGFTVIRRFPASYALGLVISNRLFFSPSSMNLYFSAQNRVAAGYVERLFNPLLYGARSSPRLFEQPHFGFTKRYVLEVNTGVLLIVMWWVALGYGYLQARRGVLERKSNVDARSVVLGFIVVTALYVYVVGTTIELAENYRYRFLVEPLFFALVAVAITDLVRAVRRRYISQPSTIE